ncbi:MAG: hypothetical protein KIT48_19000 [Pseudolabrys sp.]|nr:hypothetical protein [Pseudolabrys sp.]
MQQYRAYQVDQAGNIIGPALCFECTADDVAIEKVRNELEGYAVEVWAGDRRVGFAVPHLAVSKAG